LLSSLLSLALSLSFTLTHTNNRMLEHAPPQTIFAPLVKIQRCKHNPLLALSLTHTHTHTYTNTHIYPHTLSLSLSLSLPQLDRLAKLDSGSVWRVLLRLVAGPCYGLSVLSLSPPRA